MMYIEITILVKHVQIICIRNSSSLQYGQYPEGHPNWHYCPQGTMAMVDLLLLWLLLLFLVLVLLVVGAAVVVVVVVVVVVGVVVVVVA